MLRGLRTLSDMEYEFHMSLTNQNLDPDIETVFLMAQVEHSHFSSTLIRQIGMLGGDIAPFVPPEVQDAIRAAGNGEAAGVSPRQHKKKTPHNCAGFGFLGVDLTRSSYPAPFRRAVASASRPLP